ncbi:MAG: RdgB/HAM1 family non-canonical purine NTP pyrophosphatase [Gammaproteobacteria bacterium]|nr:RdgB/HAM1 family non-canonical purine NTP pyrophosphatase [Gammaproteobacteria bacterium]
MAAAGRLVLATGNRGKAREISTLLAPQWEVLLQTDLGVQPVAETGSSFVENALLKARHAAAATGLPALADDSGLEVDALDGAPGVHSARYAGEGASDAQNLQRLLDALRDVPAGGRTARFRCVLAWVRTADDPQPLLAEGSWEGRIALAPRGSGGFGYDPVFEDARSGLTAAELAPGQKNSLSHRGQALALLRRLLLSRTGHDLTRS